jgi:hypothetical protein
MPLALAGGRSIRMQIGRSKSHWATQSCLAARGADYDEGWHCDGRSLGRRDRRVSAGGHLAVAEFAIQATVHTLQLIAASEYNQASDWNIFSPHSRSVTGEPNHDLHL